VKATPKTTNTTPNNQKENTSTTSQTPSNLQIVTTNQLSDSSVSPKQIVTIKINDD
jgi:hypothetical protein